MKQITLVVDDKVGVLADLSYVLGKMKINIDSISADVRGGKGVISLVVSDEKRAEAVLRAGGYKVLSNDLIVIKLKDEPGMLSEVSQKLKDANVSIESLFIVSKGDGYSIIAIKADKPTAASRVLSHYMVKAD